jgi:hypothetical protein
MDDDLFELIKAIDGDRQNKKLQDGLKDIERALRKSQKRNASLPQCPICGGRLEGQFRKCMHCQSDLAWVEGMPCEPGKEEETRQLRLEEKARRQEGTRQFKAAEKFRRIRDGSANRSSGFAIPYIVRLFLIAIAGFVLLGCVGALIIWIVRLLK